MFRLVACETVNKGIPGSSLTRSVNCFCNFLSFLPWHRFDLTGGRFMTCWSLQRSKVKGTTHKLATWRVRWRDPGGDYEGYVGGDSGGDPGGYVRGDPGGDHEGYIGVDPGGDPGGHVRGDPGKTR